jgi:Ca2+-transporting ATPase
LNPFEAGGFSIEEESAAVESDAPESEAEAGVRLARTVAFTVLSLGQLFQVMSIRAGTEESFFRVWFRGNPFLFWSIIGTFALQIAVLYVPFLQTAFETVALTPTQLAVSVGFAGIILMVLEVEKLVRRMRMGTRQR